MLLDRFILKQVVPTFLLGILAFTGLFLGAGAITQIVRLAIDYNADLGVVLYALVFRLPEIITYTLPMATLFSIIFTFNRMSSDLEITAMRAAGISFLRVLSPALLFAYLVSGGAFIINDVVVPASNSRFFAITNKIKKSEKLQTRDMSVIDGNDKTKRVFYIRRVKGHFVTGVTMQEFEDGAPKRFLTARKGEWKPNNTLVLTGINTVIMYPRKNRNGGGGNATIVSTPETMEVPFNRSLETIARSQKQTSELCVREIKATLEDMKRQGVAPQIVRKTLFELHNKLAIPFASLAFALIAAPLALKPQRSSSSAGLGFSVIIILMYYIFQQLFRALGMQYINPVAAAWAPDMILFAIGTFLCAKARR